LISRQTVCAKPFTNRRFNIMAKFNPNVVKTIDQSTVEQDGSRYPVISFQTGDAKMKRVGGVAYEGGWFIAEDGAPADMTAHGWVKDQFTSNSGKDVPGYWSATIHVSVICHRKRWMVDDQPYPWNEYEKAKSAANGKAPRGHQQYLVLLKGAEDLGPFVIGIRGHAGMSFSGSRQYSGTGALSCFNRTVIAAANAQTKPLKWPFRAFWLPVGAAKDNKGQPVFTTVGQGNDTSTVVLPVPVGLPEKAAEVDLDQYCLEDATMHQVNQAFEEAQGWATAWNSFTGKNGHHQNGKPMAGEPETSEEELAEAGL
jgi:hypothetical protein